jgi:hypothetical protein
MNVVQYLLDNNIAVETNNEEEYKELIKFIKDNNLDDLEVTFYCKGHFIIFNGQEGNFARNTYYTSPEFFIIGSKIISFQEWKQLVSPKYTLEDLKTKKIGVKFKNEEEWKTLNKAVGWGTSRFYSKDRYYLYYQGSGTHTSGAEVDYTYINFDQVELEKRNFQRSGRV